MIQDHTRENEPVEYDFAYEFQFYKAEERFDKLWQMKTSARESLKDWLSASDISPQISERCANACSELIENCIKYTNNETVATVSIHVNKMAITVETINATDNAHKTLLSNSIEALQTVSDPKQLFVEKLLHPVNGSSHLGLIKIVMETKGILNFVPEQEEESVHVKLCMKAV